MHIYKYVQPHIDILRQHVSVTPVTVIRMSYKKNTINIQMVVQKCMTKARGLTLHSYNVPYGKKTTNNMRYVLFWVIGPPIVAIPYRRFGTTCRSHLQGSRNSRKELSLYLRNIPEERRSHLFPGGRPKSRIKLYYH